MLVRKLKITQNKPEERRLGFVKALKDITGLGLKDSKDICDLLCNGYNFDKKSYTIDVPFSSERTHEDLRKFTKFITEECTGDYEVAGGPEWDREIKLLSLGLGTDDEYREMVKRLPLYGDQEKIELFIDEVLTSSNRESLEKFFNKLIIEK